MTYQGICLHQHHSRWMISCLSSSFGLAKIAVSSSLGRMAICAYCSVCSPFNIDSKFLATICKNLSGPLLMDSTRVVQMFYSNLRAAGGRNIVGAMIQYKLKQCYNRLLFPVHALSWYSMQSAPGKDSLVPVRIHRYPPEILEVGMSMDEGI